MERILRSYGDFVHGGRREKGRGRKRELEIDKVGYGFKKNLMTDTLKKKKKEQKLKRY